MNLIELKEKIDQNVKKSTLLHNQLKTNQKELSQLRSQFNQLKMEEFEKYLQIGEVIEFDDYYCFKGYCKDPESSIHVLKRHSFYSGERIKVSKKNKKTIVVKVVKKIQKRWDDVQKKTVTVYESTNLDIRVDLKSFFHFYMKSRTMRAAFDSYIKRKHNLQSLLGE